MEHLKKFRSEFFDTPRMRDLYLYYIHGFSKLNCYADANEFFKLYYMNLEVSLRQLVYLFIYLFILFIYLFIYLFNFISSFNLVV
jgi:hypothetical protein